MPTARFLKGACYGAIKLLCVTCGKRSGCIRSSAEHIVSLVAFAMSEERSTCCVSHAGSRRLTAISTKIRMNLGSYTVDGSVKAILETIYHHVSRYNIALAPIIFSRIECNEETKL